MSFGNRSNVQDGDILFLYAINTSRIRYLYGYAIVIGKDNYKPTSHPKWRWSRGILPVRIVSDLNHALIHDLDNPNKSDIFPLKSGKDAKMTQGVGGCIKIKEREDGDLLLNKINALPEEYLRPYDINRVIKSMEKSHPSTANSLKENCDEWLRYSNNLMMK